MLLKKNFDDIEKKISELIKKFKNDKDQILIQDYVSKPDIAGVVFTKDKTTNSHYYDINYDFSKIKFNNLLHLIHHKAQLSIDSKYILKFKRLIQIINRLENYYK